MTRPNPKGKGFERETVNVCKSHGLTAKRTAAMQAADDEHFPDVTAWHSSGLVLAIECKHRKTLPPIGVLKAQAQADAAFPGSENVARVVAMRQQGNPGRFLVTMWSETLFDILGRIQPTGESSK